MPGARMLRVIRLIGKKWRYCSVQGSAYWMWEAPEQRCFSPWMDVICKGVTQAIYTAIDHLFWTLQIGVFSYGITNKQLAKGFLYLFPGYRKFCHCINRLLRLFFCLFFLYTQVRDVFFCLSNFTRVSNMTSRQMMVRYFILLSRGFGLESADIRKP